MSIVYLTLIGLDYTFFFALTSVLQLSGRITCKPFCAYLDYDEVALCVVVA